MFLSLLSTSPANYQWVCCYVDYRTCPHIMFTNHSTKTLRNYVFITINLFFTGTQIYLHMATLVSNKLNFALSFCTVN